MEKFEILIYIGTFSSIYFNIFILLTFLQNKDNMRRPRKEIFPLVSFIVPCLNEESNIELALNSILDLDYPKDRLSVFVIDDGSNDNTFEKAKVLEQKDERIKVFRKENGGKWTALNLALAKINSPFVATLDADCSVDKYALKRAIRNFSNPEVMAVTTTIKVLSPKKIIEGVQYAEYLIAAFFRKIFSFLDCVFVTPGPLTIFRKEVFEKVGLYEYGHGTEDLEMGFRLHNKHIKIKHELQATVYTVACNGFKSLFHQRLRWRRGFLLNLKDYPQLLNPKRYGNLSSLLIYYFTTSFLCIALLFYMLFKIFQPVFLKFKELSLIGFDISPYIASPSLLFNFDVFFITISPILLLAIFSLSIFVVFLILGKKFTFDKTRLSEKVFFYLIFYVFLNSLWWLAAFVSIGTQKDIKWK